MAVLWESFMWGALIMSKEGLIDIIRAGVNFTSKGIPWKLIAKIERKNRSEAMGLEIQIKKRGIKRYLQDNNLV